MTLTLRPYQEKSVAEAIFRFNGRAMIALEMGLGKTPIALKVAEYYGSWPVVIVCPASLTLNWRDEAKKWLSPDLKINVLRKKKDEPHGDIVICSYEVATARALELAMLLPSMVVLDESHYIKNKNAQRTKQLVPLCRRAKRCLLLTGTPILNRPVELWSQMEALNYSLGSFWEFARKYCAATKGRWGWDFSGASNVEDLNRKLRNGIMVRFLKSEVEKELPQKSRARIAVEGVGKASSLSELEKECERALSNAHGSVPLALNALKNSSVKLSDVLFRAYAELAVLKAPAASALAIDIASNSPLVCFGHHHSMLNYLMNGFDGAGISAALIDGNTPITRRHDYVRKFQDGQLQAIVCSITAASTGITLTKASDMLITELPWSPGVALQAEDRIHRIGQINPVFIRYLVAEKTLDEAIWWTISSKASVGHSILDGVKASEFAGVSQQSVGGYWEIVEQVLINLKGEKYGSTANGAGGGEERKGAAYKPQHLSSVA